MKKIYFVRHGESTANGGPITSAPDTALTQKGKDQATLIGKRISNLALDLMVVSTYTRAQETADEILKHLDVPKVDSDLFIELEKPTDEQGISRDSEEWVISNNKYNEAFLNGGRFKDGENFEDLKTRVIQILKFLEDREEENIVVVTHGYFLRVILAVVVLKDFINAQNCFSIMRSVKTTNTGITSIERGDDGEWVLSTWNDVTHFSED